MRPLGMVARADILTVGNETPTAVTCILHGANHIQIYVLPESAGGTPQDFDVILVNGTTIHVPEGGGFDFDVDTEIPWGVTAFSLQTKVSETQFQQLCMIKRASG